MKNTPYNLNGLRVLNTRPNGQNKALSQAIIQALGESIELPVMSIVPTPITWINHLPQFDKITCAIFISANAVHHFFTPLQHNKIKWPKTIQTIAIGKATADELMNKGIAVDFIPDVADSEHLLQLSLFKRVYQQSILLIKGLGGRKTISNYLLTRGSLLFPVEVYKREIPNYKQEFLEPFWQEDQVDIILLTSEQSIINLVTLLGNTARSWLYNKPCLVISARLAEIAQQQGIKHIIISQHDTIIATLASFSKGLTNDKQRLT